MGGSNRRKGICGELLVLVVLVRGDLVAAKPALANAADARGQKAQPVLRSIDSLSSPLEASTRNPVTLRGVVTLIRQHVVYLQDQTGGIAVFPSEPVGLAIGDEVEAQGEYRRADRFPPAVFSAAIRRLWSGSPPVPIALKPEQAAEGSFGNRLIDTEGLLLQKKLSAGSLRLTLEGDRQIFGAQLELSSPIGGSTQLARSLEEGSTLRLVGVCAPDASPEKAAGNAFLVLLRSTDDIRVVSPSPWWNLTHAVWLGCAAIALLSLFYHLRHRSLNLRFRAIVEERSRMARDMHDTLAQGFTGLTYQLEGLAQELAVPAERTSIERHVEMALQLVRHCREEAHRSIFALRSLTQANPDLLELLMASCDSMRTRNGVCIVSRSEGKPVRVTDETLNHLLRIGQEAITNALRHARASEITVSVRFGGDDLTLEVADNGRGFDVDAAESVDAGCFGITGMKERAKQMHGTIEIESAPEAGATIRVRAAAARGGRFRRLTAAKNGGPSGAIERTEA